MAKTAWPTGTELAAFVATIPNVTALTVGACQDIVDEVVNDFQLKTGRIPFLMDAAYSPRTFDPPDGRDRRLTLDIQSVDVQSVTINVTPTSAGTALTALKDYILEDVNAPAKGRPYEQIRLLVDPGSRMQSVVVVAKWGFGPNIPLDAWLGVMRQAAGKAAIQTLGLSGPLKMVQQGSVQRQYGIRGARTVLDDFADDYTQAWGNYVFIPSH